MAFLRFGGNIADDAGKPVKLLDPAGMSEWPSKGDQRIDALVLRVRKAMATSSGLESGLSFLLMVGIIAVYFAARPLVNRVMPAMPGIALPLCIIIAVHFIGRALWRVRLQASRTQVVHLILEEGLCACCGYNFAGLRIDQKGPQDLVTCPECGTSWRRNRIERTLPFDDHLPAAAPALRFTKRESEPTWSVADDRGMRLRLVHPRLYGALGSSREPGHRERLRAARERMSISRRWIRVFMASLLAAGAVAMTIAAAVLPEPVLYIVGFIAALFAVACLLGNFAYAPGVVRETMLEHELCPSCAEDLAQQEPSERDGCVICPGCRGAWRTPSTSAVENVNDET